MLKYNFKIEKNTDLVQEIKCDSLYMSPDLTFISGITSSEYGLVNNQPIFIREGDSSEYKKYVIQIFDKIERGYVIFENQKYKVNSYSYNGESVYGIVFGDNKKYIADNDGVLRISSINTVFDNQEDILEVNILDGDSAREFVEISTKYYVYDSVVTIANIDYEVDYDDDKPSITLKNGLKLYVQNYNRTSDSITLPNSKKVINFIIRKNLDYKVNVEHISYTKPFKYIESGNTFNVTYDNKRENVVSNKLYLLNIFINGIEKWFLIDNINNEKIELTSDNYNPNISIDTISINGVTYEIFEEWKNTSSGDQIHLYLDDSKYSFKEGDVIKATNRSIGEKEFYVETDSNNKKFVSINGVKYYSSTDKLKFLLYDNNEYEIFSKRYTTLDVNDSEVEIEQYYIMYDNTPLLITIDGSEATRLIESEKMKESFDESEKYPIKEYEYIVINDVNYVIKEQISVNGDSSNSYEVIYYIVNIPIRLAVVNVVSSNQLRCILINNEAEDTSSISSLVNSHEDYTFELENPLFDSDCVDNKPTSDRPYKDIEYRIYKSISNINIPLKLNNFNGTNIHQEYVCETDFFEVEKEKSINRIVDMEKDVYYPAYFDNSAKKFINVDKILIDLHFRTRDLETWKINNDIYNDTNSSDIVGCNWNILDYYNNNINDTESFKPYIDLTKFPYYQPSDLLYFLNFTDDDIFYQKSKVGKSFLRLSFYDTPDVRTQSLLSTSTIFMNEGNLYKKFINNRVDDGLFLSVDKIEKKVNRVISKNISVNYEEVEASAGSSLDYSQVTLTFPQSDSVTLYPTTMNEENRLSSSFVIQNMFECSESSEGFYLYLFREYSSGIHERDIYLKVEFNHAGVGRTVTFMQPFKTINDEGDREMLNMSDSNDVSLLKKGCKLQEMYDHIYIKVHVKYDFDSKRYYYYFPEWMTKHNDNKSEMRLNLYELKIADESLTM